MATSSLPPIDRIVPARRPRGAVHPRGTNRWALPETKRLSSNAVNTDSSHHEFAWEFLRRNRFYQAMFDGRPDHLPVTHWGYQWHTAIPRTHGLVRLKPYWETYSEGDPPAWLGLDDFAERLPTSALLEAKTEIVSLRPGQVLAVLDIGGLMYGQSPWEVQLWALQDRLREIASGPFPKRSMFGKLPHRKVLMRLLKLFDLVDEGASMSAIASRLHYRTPPKRVNAMTSMTQVLDRTAADSRAARVAEDATKAYQLVYQHGYLDLLRGEKLYVLQGKRMKPLGMCSDAELAG
ncbi:MAG: hypothetical protein E6R08_04960 [Nevskiaceae bacterium]|nr:MAG: hypothetical protein E6R08_04960 [Nevskiaceae bacterium]